MAEQVDAHWNDWLRERTARAIDVSAECLRASLSQRLFGGRAEVAIGGTRFTLHRRVGSGAMGTVYEVEQEGQSGSLALKVLHQGGSERAYRLKREFRVLSRLGHPNLVMLHELFADAGGSAFTMELVRGTDLLAYAGEGPDRLERLRHALAQLAEAVAALHAEGVIHRDLKPSNVLVEDGGRVVLLDFGVALDGLEVEVSGTARFMAPEQRRGRTVFASDLFALGVMLELAISAGPPSALAPADRRERERLQALSRQLTHADPEARPTALALLHALRGAPRAASGVHPAVPFVGREPELRALLAFAAARAARPRVVALEGHSGVGKSALLNEFSRRLRASEPEALWLAGRCCRREMVRYRALDPLLDALSDALLRAPEPLLEALAPCVDGHLLSLFPVLQRVPAFARRAAGGAILADARERRAAAISALRALLVQLGRDRPLLLCIDDAHWLDEESFELIRELMRPEGAPPVGWLFAARPHKASLHLRLLSVLEPSDTVRLALAPLASGDAEQLVRSLLPGRAELWPRALALGSGNPFMLLQLGQLAAEPDDISAEPSLESIIERRVAALPAPARALLRAISLSAAPLSSELLGEPSGVHGQALERALRLLEAQRYVRRSAAEPSCIEPYHDRIAECVQRSTPEQGRIPLHRAIAEALERAGGAKHARALLFHCRQAGERERALRFGELAAQQARARLSFHEAAELLAECERLAPDAARRERFVRERAGALVNAGRDREAAEILRALSQSAATPLQRFEHACEAATLFFQSGYANEALHVLDPWLRELGLRPRATRLAQVLSVLDHRARALFDRIAPRRASGPPSFRAQARVELCLLVARGFGRVDLLLAFDYASRLVLHVRSGASEQQRARALLLEAMVHANISPASGRPEALLARARRLQLPGEDAVLYARWHAAAAQCAGLTLDRSAMGVHAQRAVRLFEAHGQGVHMELAEARLMLLLARYGRGQQVAGEVEALVHDAVRRGDRLSEANTRAFLAVALLSAGDPARASAEIDRVSELNVQGPRQALYFIALAARARIDLYRGAPAIARERLAAALRSMRLHGLLLSPWLRTELRYLLALASIEERGRRAAGCVRGIARKLSRESLRAPRLLGRQLEAWLLAVDGDVLRAADALRANALDLEHDESAWYAAGSSALAHALTGDGTGYERVLASLRARGVPDPPSFLTAYGPSYKEHEP